MRLPWDRKMKRLFREIPQDIVAWLLMEATYVAIISNELDSEPIFTDILYEVLLNGKRMLLHVEFQRSRDSMMAERLWEYNQRATLQYKCAVWSVVIYLKNDGKVVSSPWTKKLPNNQLVHHFEFGVIELWKMTLEEIRGRKLVGLYPMMPLMQEGAKREVVEEIINALTPAEQAPKMELLTLTYGLASLAFANEDDQEWLVGRFTQMYDMLRETRAFQDIMKEGREEGLEEGWEKGLEKGRQESVIGLRNTLLNLVQARFPDRKLVRQAKGQAAIIDSPEVLHDLILKVALAQTPEEVQKSLLEWPETADGHN